MAYAVRGLLQHHRETNPFAFTRLLVGLDLVHDLVAVPLVILVGARLVRLVSPRFRAPVTAALVVSAVVALYAYPFVRGFGRALGPSPSRLPNNYAAGLLAVLGTVWVATGLVAVARARRR